MFKVVLTGVLAGTDPDVVHAKLAALFKVSGDQAAALLRRPDYVVKTGLDEATAGRYRRALEAAGAACRIEPDTSEGAGPVAGSEIPTVTGMGSAAAQHDASCWSCGAVLAQANFCAECGKLQQGTMQAVLLGDDHEGDNPADLIDAQAADAQPIANDAVLAFRYRLATTLKGGRLIVAAQREFTERLVPAFRRGLAGERLFDIWLQFWESNEEQVQGIAASLVELKTELSGTDNEIQKQFLERAESLIDEVNAGRKSVAHLAAFHENIRGAVDTVKAVKSSIQMAQQLLGSQVAVDTLSGSCLIYLNPDFFSREVDKVVDCVDQIGKQLDGDDSTAKAIKARLSLAERGCGALIGLKDDHVFLGKAESYLYQKFKSIPSLQRVWASGEKYVNSRLISQLEKVQADLSAQMRRVTEFVQTTNEEIRATLGDSSSGREGSSDRLGSSADLVENLSRRQQELRQLSEGKAISAIVTSTWGANAGAFVEGLGKKP